MPSGEAPPCTDTIGLPQGKSRARVSCKRSVLRPGTDPTQLSLCAHAYAATLTPGLTLALWLPMLPGCWFTPGTSPRALQGWKFGHPLAPELCPCAGHQVQAALQLPGQLRQPPTAHTHTCASGLHLDILAVFSYLPIRIIRTTNYVLKILQCIPIRRERELPESGNSLKFT